MQATDTQAGEITTDIICRNCSYNLRELREDGKCPECGFEIDFSLRDDLITPTPLEACKRLYLGIRRLRLGILLIAIGLGLVNGPGFRIVYSAELLIYDPYTIPFLFGFICLMPGPIFFVLGVNGCCHKLTGIKFGLRRIFICCITAITGSLALLWLPFSEFNVNVSSSSQGTIAIFCIGLSLALLSSHLIRIGERLHKPKLARWLSLSLSSLCVSTCGCAIVSFVMPSYRYSDLPDAVLTPAGLFFYATLILSLVSAIAVAIILWNFEYRLRHLYKYSKNTAKDKTSDQEP